MKFTNHSKTTTTALRAVVLLFVLFMVCFTHAFAGKVNVSFRESKSDIKSSELASNMLKVVNGSEKMLSFYLNLSLPQGWTSLKSADALYHLDAGDSIFIPVKVAVNPNEE